MNNKFRILAVDTCTSKCSVAITEDNTVLYSKVLDMPRGHSEALFTMIENALEEANLDIDNIDAFACSVGPGAFTGIRVGVSSIKALSLASGKPAIGVPSAEALIYGLPEEETTLVALESKRKDVYWQLFDKNKKPINDMSLSLASDVAESLKDEELLVIGDGYKHFETLISGAKFKSDFNYVLPENIAFVALEYWNNNRENIKCDPIYLRDADVSKPKKLIIPRIEK